MSNNKTRELSKGLPEVQLKCKVVSFRIADDEYLKVEALAKNKGFASVSYFAREATLKSTPFESVNTPFDVEINRLWRRVEAMTSAIEKIIAQLSVTLNGKQMG
jgi:hypothetical protein